MKHLVTALRLIFGAWMLFSGLNHFFLHLYALPTGTEPLAVQLMTSLVNSRLLDVAMAIELVAGALILAGVLTPVALVVVAPVLTCAVYWTVVLEREPVGALVALVALALNGLLLLAYIDYYRGMLQRTALAVGEKDGASFESTYVNPKGRTSRGQFVGALLTLLAVVALFLWAVPTRSGQWSLLVLLFPGVVLHARRLHDMGRSAWLLLAPGALIAASIWFRMVDLGAQHEVIVTYAALAATAAVMVWGLIGKGQVEANRFGAPATA